MRKNKNNIRIQGHYVKDTIHGGYTWHTLLDSNDNPIPFIPGNSDPNMLHEFQEKLIKNTPQLTNQSTVDKLQRAKDNK